jgi:hypothetical protein
MSTQTKNFKTDLEANIEVSLGIVTKGKSANRYNIQIAGAVSNLVIGK